jgi:hypothetical protein
MSLKYERKRKVAARTPKQTLTLRLHVFVSLKHKLKRKVVARIPRQTWILRLMLNEAYRDSTPKQHRTILGLPHRMGKS